jgi:hypothetical protein
VCPPGSAPAGTAADDDGIAARIVEVVLHPVGGTGQGSGHLDRIAASRIVLRYRVDHMSRSASGRFWSLPGKRTSLARLREMASPRGSRSRRRSHTCAHRARITYGCKRSKAARRDTCGSVASGNRSNASVHASWRRRPSTRSRAYVAGGRSTDGRAAHAVYTCSSQLDSDIDRIGEFASPIQPHLCVKRRNARPGRAAATAWVRHGARQSPVAPRVTRLGRCTGSRRPRRRRATRG